MKIITMKSLSLFKDCRYGRNTKHELITILLFQKKYFEWIPYTFYPTESDSYYIKQTQNLSTWQNKNIDNLCWSQSDFFGFRLKEIQTKWTYLWSYIYLYPLQADCKVIKLFIFQSVTAEKNKEQFEKSYLFSGDS